MNKLDGEIMSILKENNEYPSFILDPEQQKEIALFSKVYVENFSIPLYERLSIRSNLNFFKKWYNYTGSLEHIVDIFGLSHIEKERAKNIDYTDYVMIRIAIAFMQNNAKIMLVEPLHKLPTKTIKTLVQALSELSFLNKQVSFVFQQITHALILSDNVYRYKNNSFQAIEMEDSKEETTVPSKAFRLIVKIEDKTLFIKPEEVDYIEAQDGKSHITIRGVAYRSDYTLKELEEKLIPYGFFRCHRSYIVNLQKVNEIITWSKNSYSIKIQQDEKVYIPLSRQKVNELNTLFMDE